jgi:hypothetical protein
MAKKMTNQPAAKSRGNKSTVSMPKAMKTKQPTTPKAKAASKGARGMNYGRKGY